MASIRETILDTFETRMKAINGTGGFITNFSDVIRLAENPEPEVRDFTTFPLMYYKMEVANAEYEIGSRLLEKMQVNAFAIFNAELAPNLIDDCVSDVTIAVITNSNDVTMGGNADFFILREAVGAWLEEENITVVKFIFDCQYRRLALVR